jgi:hypothetical protein
MKREKWPKFYSFFLMIWWVNSTQSLLLVCTIHFPIFFGYSSEAAVSNFCVFFLDCLTKIAKKLF